MRDGEGSTLPHPALVSKRGSHTLQCSVADDAVIYKLQ
jgi:hypothetical protein